MPCTSPSDLVQLMEAGTSLWYLSGHRDPWRLGEERVEPDVAREGLTLLALVGDAEILRGRTWGGWPAVEIRV